MKDKCPSEIPDMPAGCAPDNRRPEKTCGTCRYSNPEFPVNGKPAPVCPAIKGMKGGTEYGNPRGTQHHFRRPNGRYGNGIGQQAQKPRKQGRGFAVYIHETTNVRQCTGKAVNPPRG